MKYLYLFAMLIIVSCASMNRTVQKQEKPNILFLFADDQMFNTIGALENCPVKTPHLDELMKNGVSFSRTYNQGYYMPAVCVASRTMILTGGYIWKAASFSKKGSSNIGIPLKKPEKYWPQYLKEAGYDTYMAGKWHINKITPEEVFDYTKDVRGGMPKQRKQRYTRSFEKGETDTWSPYDKKMGGYWKGGKHWSEVLADNGVSF